MKLNRIYSTKKQQNKSSIISNFFGINYIIVNHHCCSYQVMSKKWYNTEYRVQPHFNGVNQFNDIHVAIKWIDDGCPINNDYTTTVIWES